MKSESWYARLTMRLVVRSRRAAAAAAASTTRGVQVAGGHGPTFVHFSAQLEDLRDTSLTSELNLSTFGTHRRAEFVCVGNKVSLR